MYMRRINNGSWDDGIYYYRDPEYTIIHREDGPAIEYANGDKSWYLNGKIHREIEPAIEDADGDKMWYFDGKLHRKDGPAIEYANGNKEWYLNGKLHREDGPAIIYDDGEKFYYLNHKQLSKEEYIQYITSKHLCPRKRQKILKRCT